jgi:hypothetical protein
MIRRLREVWPPWPVLVMGVVVMGTYQLLFLWMEWLENQPLFAAPKPEAQRILTAVLGVVVVLYAGYRLFTCHPALRTGYYHWLRGTPWTSRLALPLGPIHLVWQDLLALAVVMAIGWPRLEWQTLVVLAVFLFAYLLILGGMHYLAGAKGWAFAVGFGIGFMVLYLRDPVPFAVAAAGTYVIAYLGLRGSLAAFPWDGSHVQKMHDAYLLYHVNGKRRGSQYELGWPYHRLGPTFPDAPRLAMYDPSLLGALAGWWFFAISYQCRMLPDAIDGAYSVYYGFLAIGILIRLAVYCDGYAPPLSLVGRLIHGRWIIPGYDQVFVAPLLAIVVGVSAWVVPRLTALDPLVTTPIAFDLTLWILLGVGPGLQVWRLTGNHRIVQGVATNTTR